MVAGVSSSTFRTCLNSNKLSFVYTDSVVKYNVMIGIPASVEINSGTFLMLASHAKSGVSFD